jgi:methylated-DNA-[protein]-cysteine S-methyltransferase
LARFKKGGMTNDWVRVTPFRRRVYEALLEVPAGRVTTYGQLAARIGCASPRAVGQALGENPFAPVVPCHRVIAGDLRPGGFSHAVAGAPLRRKLRLLSREGVHFDTAGKLADPARLWRWIGSPSEPKPDSRHSGSDRM